MPHGHDSHHARDRRGARCLVITVSDTRTPEDDHSGQRVADLLAAAGHEVREREIVHDERGVISAVVRAGVANREIDAVILTGGTGIAPRDVTHEAVEDLLEKRLDGFGEIFRMLSYEQIGAAAMLTRAIGGVIGQTVVFALPGSSKAVELGVERLIAPQLGHIVGLLSP
ncbi:MAG TPA: MogA/MoaB family molybdenum cofactor biosynthesis protein [Candidatus Binatia bacterium]|nr:MogA/MoaB family molybdenum cofactor biosynthesis protein [Candidatus Binatia bacterium]